MHPTSGHTHRQNWTVTPIDIDARQAFVDGSLIPSRSDG